MNDKYSLLSQQYDEKVSMMTNLENELTRLSREAERENARHQLINEIEDTEAKVL